MQSLILLISDQFRVILADVLLYFSVSTCQVPGVTMHHLEIA